MKPRCMNCGVKMLDAYTTNGLLVYICPNAKITETKSVSGTRRFAHIYCHTDVKGLKQAFDTLTKDTNITLEALRKVTHETIPEADLLENVNLAIMLGVPKELIVELTEAMYKLSLSIGLEPSRGIHSGCKGVGRRSRLLLDNIGITFKPSDAYEWYRAKHELDKLTTDQKTTAWQHYAIHQIREKASRLN